jgi:hypothetical protein
VVPGADLDAFEGACIQQFVEFGVANAVAFAEIGARQKPLAGQGFRYRHFCFPFPWRATPATISRLLSSKIPEV